mmetsp:Transcript_11877/g.26396  ORF Transcript_11877/g.26396 Transcript_11877/m.26396 type:complete len:200 (-) Transcript_11877:342-941(-)
MIGGNRYHFEQHDFHTEFAHFLEDIPRELHHSRSITEGNRCFFVHLGVAVQLHPFALQTALRFIAASERDFQEEWAREICETIGQYAGYVDANALAFVWPQNFDKFRICFVSGPASDPILSCFVPLNRSRLVEELYEIVLRCDGEHFTLLRPSHTRNARIRVISQMLEDAQVGGKLVQISEVESRPGRTVDAALAAVMS